MLDGDTYVALHQIGLGQIDKGDFLAGFGLLHLNGAKFRHRPYPFDHCGWIFGKGNGTPARRTGDRAVPNHFRAAQDRALRKPVTSMPS